MRIRRGASVPGSRTLPAGASQGAPHLSLALASPLTRYKDACQKPRVPTLALRGGSPRLKGLLPAEFTCGRGCWEAELGRRGPRCEGSEQS